MARRRAKSIIRRYRPKRRRGPRKFTLPMGPILGLGVGGYDIWKNGLSTGDLQRAGITATAIYTGYNIDSGSFDLSYLKRGLVPLIGGLAVHKIVGGMFGVNRLLGRVGVPVIRL